MNRQLVLGIVWLFCANSARAQIAPPPPILVGPVAPPPTTCGLVGSCCDRLRECKQRYCQSTFGQLVNNMLAPLRLATGGLVPECCLPLLTREELCKLQPGDLSPAEEAAAKIKLEEAGARARRAAVRYLGTVDCHYYPEAELALIAALRTDPNECVRLEAARALGAGCCCSPRTVAALKIAVNGGDEDCNPGETSVRVKICAFEALERCLSRSGEATPALSLEPPAAQALGRPSKDDGVKQASYTAPGALGEPVPAAGPSDAARTYAENVGALPRPTLPSGSRSLLDIVVFSRHSTAEGGSSGAAPPRLVETPRAPHGPDSLTPIGVIPR
ncbi:MAG: HEAT repeat domain-containing protein [Gemmataceae bacterium]